MNVTRTVALRDHSSGFVSVTCCICTDNMWPTGITLALGPRIVEWKQRITCKVPGTFFSPSENREEKMIERFHGIDRHKKHFTASVLNREGKEIEFVTKCTDLRGYLEKLGAEDAVIVEASAGAFYWADLMESQGTICYVLDPYKFKIIRDS